jgi:hypothetical protein
MTVIDQPIAQRAPRVPVEAITSFVLGGVVFAVFGVAVALGYLPLPHL